MVIEKLKSWLSPSPKTSTQVISLDQLAEYVGGQYDSFGLWSGDKFPGGFGVTKDYTIKDYWVLRLRSKQLFEENLYARGMIRRLVTNEINKGLALEATPDSSILGLDDDEVGEWAENVERRFLIWNQSPFVCDFRKQRTFGAIQRQARMMALISGDVLVVLVPNQYGLPSVELVDASYVTTPNNDKIIREASNRGNEIVHGVEVSNTGEHVAFYIQQKDGTHKRLAAYGNRTGRRMAWLYYGTERMIDDVRGTSILACVMQSLKELDRYRDSELRAAVINSMVAMWIEKTEDKMGTLPITGGAVRKDVVQTQSDSQGRKDVEFSANMPGMVMQELQTGEKPTSYDTRRPNVNYGTFEAAVINAMAWANEIPPEVLTLAFEKNYSASRGAVNEFKMYLDKSRNSFGEEFNTPIYIDWLISEVLNNNIIAPGFIDAWRNTQMWDKFGAWCLTDWAGAIKPALDPLKEVNAYKMSIVEGLITRERAARELNGGKYSKIVRQIKKENEQLAEALKPLVDAGLIKNENPDIMPADTESEDDAEGDMEDTEKDILETPEQEGVDDNG